MKFRRILVCTSVLLAGCGMVSPAPGAPQQPKSEVPPKPEAAPASAVKTPPPVPETKIAAPKDRQLVINGRFEEWDEALPKGWVGNAKQVSKSKEVTSGKNAVELVVSDEYTLIEQAVVGVPKGRKFLVSAKIKAAEPKDAAIKAIYYQGDEIKEVRKQYSGDGDWSVNSFEVTLPDEASANGFRIQIIRNPDAEGPVLIDDVAVIVPAEANAKPAAAAPAAAAKAAEAPAAKKEEAPAAKKADAPAEKKADAPAAKKADAPAKK